MTKKEAIEEFEYILPDVLEEYGDDSNIIREEIWQLYVDHLYVAERITLAQKKKWKMPEKLLVE